MPMSPTYYEDEIITGPAIEPNPPEWLQLGDFSVSIGLSLARGERRLQTRVFDAQGNVRECWDGVDPDHLSTWIAERARQAVPADLPEERRHPVLQLSKLQVAETRPGVLLLSGHLELDAYPVSVEPSEVEVFLTNLEDGGKRSVAVEKGDVACYRIFTVEFPLPASGRYVLTVQARLSGRAGVNTESEGPTLRIE